MSTDPLEQFVRNHRESFDTEVPSEDVWRRLEADLHRPPLRVVKHGAPETTGMDVVMRQLYPYTRKLAVACMLLAIGVLVGLLYADRTVEPEVVAEGGFAIRSAELEEQYQRELQRRIQLVNTYNPEPGVKKELASLVEPEFRQSPGWDDLPPDDERLILKAMAQEYQAKLDVLERVISRLEAAERIPTTESESNVRPAERL